MKNILYSLFMLLPIYGTGQVTFSNDVAPIIYNHCTSCHRPGEIGPMPLTNFDEIKGWANTIKYVTSNKLMPPWKADPTFSKFLDENYLTASEIQTIANWVNSGSPRGDISQEPPIPVFPQNSLLGTPDLKLSFKSKYTHKGNGKDEYRYFVLPTGLTESKKLKAIELRPGNTKIVHHALFFADESGKAKTYDDKTPEYGFSVDDNNDFNVLEVINRDQFPGYVPGQKPRKFPDGLAQNLPANSDLVIQMHYAPWGEDESDSSSVNLFFADKNEVIDRVVKDYIMLPFNLTTGANSFFILANQTKRFEGVYTVPFDISLVGIFPHMHYLGKNWEVYITNPDGTKENLIKINDWDFNWQGGYYFDKYKIAKKGSIIHAFATYDNTSNNPNNPTIPPKFVTWGEGTKDEMYYLPLLYVPYNQGDENVIFDQNTSTLKSVSKIDLSNIKIFPNPSSSTSNFPIHISFDLLSGMPVSIQLFNFDGSLIRKLKDYEYFGQGNHIVHLQPNNLLEGKYIIKLTSSNSSISLPIIITK